MLKDRSILGRVSLGALLGVALMLALLSPVRAQGVVAPQYMEPVWQASYWSNSTLSGPPVLWRSEAQLHHDWGTGSPDYRIPADHFSARWSRYIDIPAGHYRFSATSDDGVRVWIDGQLIIDGWYDHPPQTFTADRYVSSGEHMVMVSYYENMGGAMIQFSWTPIQPEMGDWRAEYYNNTWLGGLPTLVRNEAEIDFRWDEGSPAPGVINPDRFSARWTRQLDLPAGRYRFSATVDDGTRLWVDDRLIIDAWFDTPPRTFTADVYIDGGSVPIRMEYYENGGIAVATLNWEKVSGSPPLPEFVVDDQSPGFVRGGSSTGWRTAYTGYNGRLTWTRNNDWQRARYNWARWYPDLRGGRYEVYVYIPDMYSTTQRARYWVAHRDGFTLRVVDQSSNGGRWVSLGTYWFQGDSKEYVSLNDITYEPYLARLIAFDAVKWVPR